MAEEKQKKDKGQGQQKGGAPKGGGAKGEKKGEKKPKKAAPEQEAGGDDQPQQPAPPARLAITYREQISPALMQRFGYRNRLQAPRLEKIVISMGLGKAVTA